MSGIVGASPELLAEHAKRHSATCPGEGEAHEVPCPCGGALAIVCAECGDAVFLVLLAEPPCSHAAELLGAAT